MDKSIIFLSFHLLCVIGNMPVFKHPASWLLEGNFQKAEFNTGSCVKPIPSPSQESPPKLGWNKNNELIFLKVLGTSLLLDVHSSFFSITLTSCMFSFPLSCPDSSYPKSSLPSPSPHHLFSAPSLFCPQLSHQSSCWPWCWPAPRVPLSCQRAPSISQDLIPLPGFWNHPLSLFSLFCPPFHGFPCHHLFPFLAPCPYPVPQLSVPLLSHPPASLLHPHLSSQGLSMQDSPSLSPLPPSTTPSPLSCLLQLPPELGSQSSSAPSLSPHINSCSGGAGTDGGWDLHGATGVQAVCRGGCCHAGAITAARRCWHWLSTSVPPRGTAVGANRHKAVQAPALLREVCL